MLDSKIKNRILIFIILIRRSLVFGISLLDTAIICVLLELLASDFHYIYYAQKFVIFVALLTDILFDFLLSKKKPSEKGCFIRSLIQVIIILYHSPTTDSIFKNCVY